MENLRQGLVTYIGYCSKNDYHRFSYRACAETLASLGFPCKPTTLRKEFSILKKEGLIEFRTYYHRPYPVLSQAGRFFIKTKLPFKSFKEWDEKWRVVIFDIPEEERKYRYELREKLKSLGFAQIHPGVYLSPHPLLGVISRLTSNWGIRQHVNLMEVCRLEGELRLALEAWDIESINRMYKEYIEKAKKTARDTLWVFRAKELEQEFAQIYEKDPHLPEKFLPKSWHGEEAYQLFREISNSY